MITENDRQKVRRILSDPMGALVPERLIASLIEPIATAIAQERERCAQVAELPFGPGLADRDDYWQPRIAAAIRALD